MKLHWTWVVLVLAGPSLALGQSMGEAARKEAERREKNKKAGVKAKTYGDQELKDAPPPSQGTYNPAGDAGSDAGTAPSPSPPAIGSGEVPVVDESALRAQQETEWRKRVGEATAKRDKAKSVYEKVSTLSLAPGEFYEDDQGRVLIKDLEELRRLIAQAKARWDAAERDLENLFEQARRANVPPGWLR